MDIIFYTNDAQYPTSNIFSTWDPQKGNGIKRLSLRVAWWTEIAGENPISSSHRRHWLVSFKPIQPNFIEFHSHHHHYHHPDTTLFHQPHLSSLTVFTYTNPYESCPSVMGNVK